MRSAKTSVANDRRRAVERAGGGGFQAQRWSLGLIEGGRARVRRPCRFFRTFRRCDIPIFVIFRRHLRDASTPMANVRAPELRRSPVWSFEVLNESDLSAHPAVRSPRRVRGRPSESGGIAGAGVSGAADRRCDDLGQRPRSNGSGLGRNRRRAHRRSRMVRRQPALRPFAPELPVQGVHLTRLLRPPDRERVCEAGRSLVGSGQDYAGYRAYLDRARRNRRHVGRRIHRVQLPEASFFSSLRP
jgi:hypothetical protein